MKLIVFTEYSREIGFGHINRTLSLADEFFSNGWEVEYCIREANTIDFSLTYRYELFDWGIDLGRTLETTKEADVILIDTYRVGKDTLNLIVEDVRNPITIIDSTLNYPTKGLLIFGSVYADQYSVNKQQNVLGGPKYMLLRKSFLDMVKDNKVIRETIENVIITLGKFAERSLLSVIIDVLTDLLPNTQLHLIGTSEYLPKDNVYVHPFLPTNKYISLLQSADLVVCNGGQTLNECVALSLPNISVMVTENQRMNIDGWMQRGVTHSVGAFDACFKERLQQGVKALVSIDNRMLQYKQGRGVIDFAGPNRIFKYVINGIKSN